jgi:ABC-type phosphate transport system auxiliary subunit
LEYYPSIFTITKKIKFEPHKGDEVSAVNAQVLIRDEMQSRFIQMQDRLASLKTENDEVCLYFSYFNNPFRTFI